MAWIGLIDEQDKIIKPVVWNGLEEGYLTKIINISTNDIAEGRSPTGRAIRDGKYFCCNDIANDPIMDPGAKRPCSAVTVPPSPCRLVCTAG